MDPLKEVPKTLRWFRGYPTDECWGLSGPYPLQMGVLFEIGVISGHGNDRVELFFGVFVSECVGWNDRVPLSRRRLRKIQLRQRLTNQVSCQAIRKLLVLDGDEQLGVSRCQGLENINEDLLTLQLL
jgi:hypothetical protein